MNTIDASLELWLRAERQQMARPEALTAYLNDKSAMLNAVGHDPNTAQNTGAIKARTHIGNCMFLLDVVSNDGLSFDDSCKKLGELAAKALKVASGYAMRAGYFHPVEPTDLYRTRMVALLGDEGEDLPVLGSRITHLTHGDLANEEDDVNVDALKDIAKLGMNEAAHTDKRLQELLHRNRSLNPDFMGSYGAWEQADEITFVTRGLFASLAVGAIRLQGSGPQGLGPLILEPKSDSDADYFLRVTSIDSNCAESITTVWSDNTVKR